jgi:EAL domain-containing protein (putative c-di-GMP-specific phosphodiesterase class I)
MIGAGMTALAAPYLLRRDGEARISHAESPRELPPPFLDEPAPERRAGLLRQDVARIIAERGFSVAFQPVVRLADARPVSAEALLRLRPPPGRPTRPARDFAEAARGFGLGTDLDGAVLDVALATWPRDAATPMSVNVDASSLRDPTFFAAVLHRLRGEAATAGLEIGAPRQPADLPPVIAMARALRGAGVRVVLDDFDVDTTNLTCLCAVRFDEVKFSADVMNAALASERGQALLRELVRLAGAACTRPVAKQIETRPQARLMQQLGVTHGQGWLFGSPVLIAADRERAA